MIADEQWRTAIAAFRTAQCADGIKTSTVMLRCKYLNRLALAAQSGPWEITDTELEAFEELSSWAPATKRTARAAMAAFFHWAKATDRRPDFPECLEHRTRMRHRRSAEQIRQDPWVQPREAWLEWLKAGGVTPEGLKLRAYQITRFAREMTGQGPWDVTDDDLAAWLGAREWSRETLRSYRSVLRSFYGWAHANGLSDVDPSRLLRKVPAMRGAPRPAPERAIEDALAAADERQYLILMLGAHAGLRRAEIAALHTQDLFVEEDGYSLIVHGKGGKDRLIPLLDDVARIIRETEPGWVFPNGMGSHLTPAHVGVILRGVLPPGVTCHQLRHRFASIVYQRTKDLRAVQELLGHSSVATTQVYTQIGHHARRAAVLAAGRRGA